MFWTNLLKTGAQTGAAAAAGTAASAGVDSPWYRDLRKPGLQPPAAVFPVVWTVLYADLAVTSAAVTVARPVSCFVKKTQLHPALRARFSASARR